MSRTQFGILSAIGILCIVAVLALIRQSKDSQILEQQLALTQLSAENQRLSNMVVQAKLVQANTRSQLEEVLKLRSDVNRLQQDKDATNRLLQAQFEEHVTNEIRELAALRTEVSGLEDEMGNLRDGLLEAYTNSPANTADDRSNQASNNSTEDRTLTIRMIETHGDAFAEKLKSAAHAADTETFPEVFGRYLRANGVDLNNVAALAYDERTGRVIVRAPRGTADVIERVTMALDRGQ
jgi:hypothetical protein